MNNEQQTWILKPGHEILNGKDNDYEWTALVKPGEDVTTGITGEEYWASQEPVFDTLLMGEIPSDEDLEKSKQFRV